MAEGAWVVLGAAIGTVGSIVTTWLNAYLSKKPPDPYEEAATSLLKEILEKGYKWRSLDVLSNVIGASHQDTRELLLMLGARGSETDSNLWGLKSRNPLPDHLPENSSQDITGAAR